MHMTARAMKKVHGSGTRANHWSQKGTYGITAATMIAPMVNQVSRPLGRDSQNGTRRVRMMKTMSVCVHMDSTNQAVWNSATPAWNTQSMRPKVTKSKMEEIGPKMIMKRRMKPMSQWVGLSAISSSMLSVGITIWAIS